MSTKKTARPKGWKRGAYILRTCAADLSSNGGSFTWPESWLAEAPDWRPTEACGHGLHGFLNGEGDGSLACFDPDAKWIVAEIEEGWIDLRGKVKFPRAFVVHCGDRLSATEFLAQQGVNGAIVGGTATAGYRGTVLIRFYDHRAGRYRIIAGYIGEDGIEPNKPYCVKNGKLVELQR